MHKRLTLLTLILLLSSVFSTAVLARASLSDRLLESLDETEGPVPVILVLHDVQPLPALFSNELRNAEKIKMLRYYRLEAQQELRSQLRSLYEDFYFSGDEDYTVKNVKFFWIANVVTATVSKHILSQLRDHSSVKHIFEDARVRMIDARVDEVVDSAGTLFGDPYTYGLQRIGMPEVWAEKPELIGSGVTVGIIDTGIEATHKDLTGKSLLFKDFISGKEGAYDDNGHGTHVAGTIAGGNADGTQIGVAPGVKIISGKVFDRRGYSSLSAILNAMEWMADPDGNPDTNDQPVVVNNSWGGSMGDDSSREPFWEIVLRWVDLGIFPSFAAGNSGPSARSVGRPAGYPHSFAVGATDANDGIASFSSRGPVKMRVNGEWKEYKKPEVSAPGHKVLSAYPGGRYASLSGTSMATPHLTGAVAILKQLKPDLTITQAAQILQGSATDLGEPGMDNSFGYGRIYLPDAIEMLSRF